MNDPKHNHTFFIVEEEVKKELAARALISGNPIILYSRKNYELIVEHIARYRLQGNGAFAGELSIYWSRGVVSTIFNISLDLIVISLILLPQILAPSTRDLCHTSRSNKTN
ncbi:hypothetical protein D9758_007726 [Tetrapyrgos nigripes]|uniref:Uncharacterized protein n=1 Tax=Tetrapyrgos nigripes TaxID=182062 RepID=A0A8H5G5I5_9AGAR|nr:hypothetical protein D9758_007726 [Tetrapyrgos nigripes]